jgi:HEPN domain-containing protein
MPAPDEAVLTVLREWVEKAENDLTAARQILRLGRAAPMDTICFHAQQCVEKYLKAMLVQQGVAVPKTHNMQAVMKLVPRSRRPVLTSEEQKRLTSYAAVTRYPGAGLDIALAEGTQVSGYCGARPAADPTPAAPRRTATAEEVMTADFLIKRHARPWAGGNRSSRADNRIRVPDRGWS